MIVMMAGLLVWAVSSSRNPSLAHPIHSNLGVVATFTRLSALERLLAHTTLSLGFTWCRVEIQVNTLAQKLHRESSQPRLNTILGKAAEGLGPGIGWPRR